MSAETFQKAVTGLEFVPVTRAVTILKHFDANKNWNWFLAQDRLGRTDGFPPIRCAIDDGQIVYCVNVLVEFIREHIQPYRSSEEILKIIERFKWERPARYRSGDAELDELLEDLSSVEPMTEILQSDDEDGCGPDVALALNEVSFWNLLSALAGVAAEQDACGASLVVMSSLMEAMIAEHGSDRYPQYQEFLTFGQAAVQHAKQNAQRIKRISTSIETMALIDPNHVFPEELTDHFKDSPSTTGLARDKFTVEENSDGA